ncbi:MAG: hypothetical protein HWN65_17860 [Candidatus Helarchaeota archaeon]|nr:hypothetical protein [Candidatus Helarchaeota archaeon]
MTEESSWTRLDIVVNLISMIILMTFGTFILVIKCWRCVLAWAILWGLYIIVGRYVTCRHCDYLGKPCPSWCMGIIGGWLYERSEKKNFCEDGYFKLFVFDILFMVLAILIPYIKYIIDFIRVVVFISDVILIIIYTVIVVITLVLHQKFGCRKCSIIDCPLNANQKLKKQSLS